MSNKNIILVGAVIRVLLVVFLTIATVCGFFLAIGLLSTINQHGGFSNVSLSLRQWSWLLSPIFFGVLLYFVARSNKKNKLKKPEEKTKSPNE